jgi:hypothetical protein
LEYGYDASKIFMRRNVIRDHALRSYQKGQLLVPLLCMIAALISRSCYAFGATSNSIRA